MSDNFQPPSYPVVGLLVRHGRTAALLLAVAVALAGLIAAALVPLWWLAPAGIAAAALLAVLLLSYIEVLRIISDTLLPRY